MNESTMRLRSDGHVNSKVVYAVAIATLTLAACSSEVSPTAPPSASPMPPTQPTLAFSSVPSSTLPASPSPTAAVTTPTATLVSTPTPLPSLHGDYVGVLGWFSGCVTLDSTSNLYEIYLPANYRLIHPSGTTVGIVDPSGKVVARDGDLVGLDAEPLIGGGSACQLGHKLTVSQIVSVVSGAPSTPIENWSVSCGATNALDCQSITQAFINSFAGWGASTVIAGTGRQLAVETWTVCGVAIPAWAAGTKCWQAIAPWPSSQPWQPKLPGRICEVFAQGDGTDGITGVHQFAGDYLGGAAIGPAWPACKS